MTAPPTDVWVDPRLVVAPSAIAGSGLFADAPIAAGEVVMRIGGRLVSPAALDDLIAATLVEPTLPYVDTFTIEEDAHLVLPAATTAHFANHCCDPSLWWVGSYSFAARRPIDSGEEATLDYATISGAAGFEMACACGSVDCRGVVTSDDWRLVSLQECFSGHWVPALTARIAALRR